MATIKRLANSHFVALAALLVTVAGCGGAGGASSLNSDARLVLTAGAGYNGSSVRLSAKPSASVTNGATVVLVSQGARTFVISLPTASPQNGAVYTVGQNGTSARYSEAVLGSSDNVWNGTGGTISVRSLRNTLFLTVTGATFVSDSTNGSQAQGTFSASGTVNDVAF